MAISKRLRYEILRRDNHACRYCGATAADGPLTIDHVIPQALGGEDDPDNLVTACVDCNEGKSSMPADATLVADVSNDTLRWSRAMLRVAEIRAHDIADQKELFSWFNMIWCQWTNWRGDPLPAPEGFGGILKFIAAGLSRDELEELVDVTMRANHVSAQDKWRYFCGCCWNRVRDNIDMAAMIIEAEDTDPDG